MNIKSIKRVEKRVDVPEYRSLDIQGYGIDNLYPNNVADIVASSVNATQCLRRLQRFIKGGGFANIELSEIEVNGRGDTFDDLLNNVVNDYATYNGFALHVNYNIIGQVVSVSHIPFEMVRLCTPNEYGKVEQVAVFADWSGRKTIDGRRVTPKADNIDYINVFDSRRDVVLRQIEESNGIDSYKGQVLYCSSNGHLTYPIPIYDAALGDISTDEGLSNIRYRNTRNSFLMSGVLVTKEGTTATEGVSPNDTDEFDEALRAVQGDMKACSLLHMTIGRDDDMPTVLNFEPANYDDKFRNTEESTVANIYAVFEQEPFYRIRSGSVGFSSEMIGDAYRFYASIVRPDQLFIERAFAKVFKVFYRPVGDDFTIAPAKYEGKDE